MRWMLLGFKGYMVPIPWAVLRLILPRQVAKTKQKIGGATLDEEQRRVHHFVVRELPRLARAMQPEHVAEKLEMKLSQVITILDELERRLIYLFRPGGRDVVWAYPITAEPTPHRLAWSSGERLWAA